MKRFMQRSNYFFGGLHFAGLYHNIDDNIYIWYNIRVNTIYSRFILSKKIDISNRYKIYLSVAYDYRGITSNE